MCNTLIEGEMNKFSKLNPKEARKENTDKHRTSRNQNV